MKEHILPFSAVLHFLLNGLVECCVPVAEVRGCGGILLFFFPVYLYIAIQEPYTANEVTELVCHVRK